MVVGNTVIMAKHIEYVYLESDIHHFKWLRISEEATIEYYDLICGIYDNLPENTTTIRILHNYHDIAFTPFTNILPKMKSLQLAYPNLKRRIAYLSNSDATHTLVDFVTNTVNRTGKRNFFKLDGEQLAIEWLLSDE